MKIFGNKEKFGFELEDEKIGGLLPMEIYAANISLTPFDKNAYLPSFIVSMEHELEVISRGNISESFIYFSHGPTTDDVHGKIELSNGLAKLDFEFDEQRIVSVKISIAELIDIYSKTLDCLRELNA